MLQLEKRSRWDNPSDWRPYGSRTLFFVTVNPWRCTACTPSWTEGCVLRSRRPTTAARLEASSLGLLKASAKASTGFGLGVGEWTTTVGAPDGRTVGTTVAVVVGALDGMAGGTTVAVAVGAIVGADVGRADAGSLHAGDVELGGHER